MPDTWFEKEVRTTDPKVPGAVFKEKRITLRGWIAIIGGYFGVAFLVIGIGWAFVGIRIGFDAIPDVIIGLTMLGLLLALLIKAAYHVLKELPKLRPRHLIPREPTTILILILLPIVIALVVAS